MGMRYGGSSRWRPAARSLAAVAQAAEAAALAVAIVLNAIDSASGARLDGLERDRVHRARVHRGRRHGLDRGRASPGVRPWSRTPAVMTQVLTGVIAVWLLQAHRFDWGVPALLLAIAGLAGLLAPPACAP